MPHLNLKKLAEFVLEFPLKEEVSLGYFVSLIIEKFDCDETEINDLLTDLNSEKNTKFLELLQNKTSKRNRINDIGIDIKVIPKQESINLARNDIATFERECHQMLQERNDADKGRIFERIVQYLLKKIGIETKTTEVTGDNGIDLIGKGEPIPPTGVQPTYFIQCKYYSGSIDINIPKKIASDVLYNLFDTDSAIKHPIIPILVHSSKTTSSSAEFSKKYGITILSFSDLLVRVAEKNEKIDFQEMLEILEMN